MTELKHGEKPMKFDPINISIGMVVGTLRLNEPVVVILEPGDMTRYHLLLVPMHIGDYVSPHLQSFGIQQEDADNYLFVSKLSGDECPGTWVPFGSGREVGTHDVTELSINEWSRKFLSWWLTKLCEAY